MGEGNRGNGGTLGWTTDDVAVRQGAYSKLALRTNLH